MKRLPLFLSLLMLLLIPALPALAQQGKFIIKNETDEALEMSDLLPAAQPLIDRGATVAIYFVKNGERDEFNQRLRDDGLMRGDLIDDSLIAIFVSLEDRYSEIAYGDNWVAALNPRAEGIRSGALGRNLREGAYALAFTRALEDIENVIANPAALPPNSTFQPISTPTSTSSEGTTAVLPVLCVIAFVAFFLLSKLFPDWFPANSAGTYTSGPRYKSSWSSSHRSSFSSHRSSGRSFGGGGRSGGKW